MWKTIFQEFFINKNNYILKKLQKIVININNMEYIFEKLHNCELRNKTIFFKKRLSLGETLDDILPEAFATVREASKRIFGMRHFDVQLLGGIALHKKYVTEMRTGEGKTLTSTLPAYLNALDGKGVHIITMNDYLAKRDAKKNTPLFNFLGLTVGLNTSNMSIKFKKKAYAADITYATNNEFGFDYLKDNMIYSIKDKVQRSLNYAIIDEIDSILIDEARTPLIISGSLKNDNNIYILINKYIIPNLIFKGYEDSKILNKNGDFIINEKYKQLYLTELGFIKIEKLLYNNKFIKNNKSLYSIENISFISYIISALRAHYLYFKDKDYIVKNNEVIIVDEHTGRIMPGRRWSDGIHQSIEAKEKVNVKNENQILASITLQNYFKLYKKISGMTGTADTESFEFRFFYNLNTIVIPTNFPMIRNDMSDLVFLTNEEKLNAIIKDILYRVKKKQPVLVGTISIEQSEIISNRLKILKVKHNVLNAKMHEKEADIIAQAGAIGSVTIATNMAGRGTDIVLGGCKEKLFNINYKSKILSKKNIKKKKKWDRKHKFVLKVGGLHIIGTERHESRRIDNQLRGRSGRQGDIGSSQFYVSLEDTIMRMFISENMLFFLKKLRLRFGKAIKNSWVNSIIEQAQIKIEKRNFDFRKQIIEYDHVLNEQRFVIYQYRNMLLNSNNINSIIKIILIDVIKEILNLHFITNNINHKDIFILQIYLKSNFNVNITNYINSKKNIKLTKEDIYKEIFLKISLHLNKIEKFLGFKNMRLYEKSIILQTLDMLWKEQLINIDYLRQSINLRGYAQKDPKQEYIKESFKMFVSMLDTIKYQVISILSNSKISSLNINNPIF